MVYDGESSEQVLHDAVSSVYEYAYSIRPDGADNYEWTGSGHENEVITTTFKDPDGNDLVVSAEVTTATAVQVIVTNSGKSRHSETGETDIATVMCVLTFDDQGVQVYHKHDWLVDTYVLLAHAAMMPFDDAHTKYGHIAGDTDTKIDLTPNDGQYHGFINSRAAAMWSDVHNWVGWCYVTNDAGVLDWEYSAGTRLEDRDTAALNKIYIPLGGKSSNRVGLGDTFETTTLYRISNVADPDTTILPI